MFRGFLTYILVGLVTHASHRREQTPVPDPPAPFVRFTAQTDNIPRATIWGVILPANGRARGTLFLAHGWGRRKEDLYGWDWIRRERNWNLVLFDFREHGQSSHSPRLCSLGYFEIWDLKAVIDLAQQRGLARPYAIYGNSLGASVGLRWAGRDSRIEGVLALSPYRNGLAASRQFLRASTGWDISPFRLHPGFRRMVETVDLPSDLATRGDLRIWIMCGQYDCFPETDQRAILAGSASPADLKRLLVVPRHGHGRMWSWKGDARVPSHDQMIREFLAACERN